MPEQSDKNQVDNLKSKNKKVNGQLLYFLQEQEIAYLDIINTLECLKRTVDYMKRL